MSRVAAIDCGTNSIRLLIAEPAADGSLTELVRRTEIVRLGQGIDATGEFHPDALRRTFATTQEYADLIAEYGVSVDRIRFVATSAARDARNRDEFAAGIERLLGVTPEVIEGDTEARLSFAGAISGAANLTAPVLVMDIGGGSTELIIGTPEGEVLQAVSLDIGAVRLTERYLGAGPVEAAEIDAAGAYVTQQLDGSGVDLTTIGSWIGVAGTATTVSAIYLGLAEYDRARVHRSIVPTEALIMLFDELSEMTVDEIRAIPSMHPQRADVITGGLLIASLIALRVPVADLEISESDILDGIAQSILG